MATDIPTVKKPQNSLVRPLTSFLQRFHLLLFFIFVVGCLATAVVLLNKTLIESAEEPGTSSIDAGSIDQATLERIQSLHTSNQPSPPPALPAGRVNPFSE